MKLLQKNFRLSLWLTRLAFVAASIFGRWFEYASALALAGPQYGIDISLYGSFWGVVLYGVISSVIVLVILTWFSGWIFRYTRIHNLPMRELSLFVVLFAAIKNIIAGIFKLSYLITPLFIGWGKILFDSIALIIAVILFYFFINKHYLPKGNKAVFFNTLLTVSSIFLVIQLVLGVYMYL